jgi:hypothetical protein
LLQWNGFEGAPNGGIVKAFIDAELAEFNAVPTKRLNEQVK